MDLPAHRGRAGLVDPEPRPVGRSLRGNIMALVEASI